MLMKINILMGSYFSYARNLISDHNYPGAPHCSFTWHTESSLYVNIHGHRQRGLGENLI